MSEPQVQLRKAVERTLSAGHPWVFRDALAPFEAPLGSPVTVLSRNGAFVARGYACEGPIAVRVLTTRDVPVDDALFGARIDAAAALRERVLPPETDAYRLLHGEGDRLPGIVCDVYGAYAVVKPDGEGAAALLQQLEAPLLQALRGRGVEHVILRRGRGETRSHRMLAGVAPDGPISVRERGMRLWVDLLHGQKTGMFLDHRDSRARVRELAGGLSVLNLYAYTGGFSVAAGLGGASEVTSVDVAPAAVTLAERNMADNGIPPQAHRGVCADVMAFLGDCESRFDLVVSDPPSFAPSEATRARAIASYVALHRAGLARVREGGLYLAASCSSHVDREAFDDTLRQGAREGGHLLQVLARSGAPADHPRLLGFPEGDYLKIVLCRVFDGGRPRPAKGDGPRGGERARPPTGQGGQRRQRRR